jgi:NAD-dependent deacetylase
MKREEALKRAKEILLDAQSLVVFTGAGISAESGIPTFRGQGGLWRQYRAMDLATPEAFARNPKLVWEFYNWRRELIAKAEPNPAHKALVELEKFFPQFTLITQNVDGLHQKAGSQKIIELHGNIWWVRCTACPYLAEDRRVPLPLLPHCPQCGALLRPHVVWFGETLDPNVLQKTAEVVETTEVMLVIGTSAVVHPAASFIVWAKQKGVRIIEVNLEKTPVSSLTDVTLLGKAGEILPKLVTDYQRGK